ncbi:MAG: hypothetical protein QOG41_1243 [Thermoleophilaceae bacterium]|jgi:hypothetical protein|nr:hypothetical protein [Thermoleophilaceae bacterium]
MNVNRVTLSAFGTTGVLLAASLTMLAIVSALVTFDAWPTREGAATADGIAIERAPTAHQVRAVRRAGAASGKSSHRGRDGSAAALAVSRLGGGAAGPGGPPATDPGSPAVPAGPTPYVPSAPPGEGDPTTGYPVSKKDDPTTTPRPIHEITCGAGQTVGDVNGGAGAALGSACKTAVPPPSTSDTSGQPPADAVTSG